MRTPASRTATGSVGVVDTQFLDLPKPLALDCGRELHPIRIAYETYGTLSPARDNVILVCHALSGDAHAAGFAKTPAAESTRDGFGAEERDAGRGLGWWDGMIGPGQAFDTDRFFVISTNLLGGCRGTTGPPSTNPATGRHYGSDFPVITVADMVQAQRAFLDELGIARLAAVAGGSLGGMQALEWAVLYADQVDAIIPIASTHALHPQGIAWNAIARNAITADPDWQGGHYYGTGRAPTAGMGVARMVGHITYLSAKSLNDKFGRRLQLADDIRYHLTEPEFEVESYLRYQADAFVTRFDAIPLLVDNTFATPFLCRPIEWGADIVLHSATKFIGGHGTSIGGVVVDAGQFNWSKGRFPVVADPSPAYHGLQFHETFGTYGYLMKLRAETLRDLGAAMSPFNAFLFLQGLETLSLRMARHVENAAAVAGYLESHELASRVTYPGLRTSRYRTLVDKYLPRGAGAVFSFDCRGDRAAGQDFIRGVTLWSHLANVGDSKSLIIHPASTTHRQLNDEELRAAGVGPGTIRLSVGIEAVDDLIWDLEQGFARAAASATREVASL